MCLEVVAAPWEGDALDVGGGAERRAASRGDVVLSDAAGSVVPDTAASVDTGACPATLRPTAA